MLQCAEGSLQHAVESKVWGCRDIKPDRAACDAKAHNVNAAGHNLTGIALIHAAKAETLVLGVGVVTALAIMPGIKKGAR